jgi:hypothetical protein
VCGTVLPELARLADTDHNAPVTLTLDLNPELERQLRNEAAARGLTLEQLVLKDLEARVVQHTNPTRLSHEETRLMQVITEGLPEDFWARYRHLIDLREQKILTDLERTELITCSDQVESLTASRTEALGELARLRGLSVYSLRDQLGLQPVPTAA